MSYVCRRVISTTPKTCHHQPDIVRVDFDGMESALEQLALLFRGAFFDAAAGGEGGGHGVRIIAAGGAAEGGELLRQGGLFGLQAAELIGQGAGGGGSGVRDPGDDLGQAPAEAEQAAWLRWYRSSESLQQSFLGSCS